MQEEQLLERLIKELQQGNLHEEDQERLDTLHNQARTLFAENARLRESNEQLRLARSHYHSIHHEGPIPYLMFDPRGVVISMNLAAADLLGLPHGHTHFSFLQRLAPDTRDTFNAHLQQIYGNHRHARCELLLIPHKRPTPDGSQRDPIYVALDSAWMKQPDSPHGYCLSACIDISGFKRLQADLEEAREQAIKASSLKSQFLANMSHEIRTPLSSVLGYVDLLRQDITIPEQREKLQIVYKAGKHLLFLINEIIDLSRIEHGRLTIKREAFLPSALLDDLQDLFEVAAEDRGIKLSFTREFVPEPLVGDAERLRQVLVNIIGNALKFTPERGIVQVHVSFHHEKLNFHISDTGPGIAADQLEAIFEMFHQADNSDTRSHGGSGLGLAISQKLVEMMEGTIEIESTIGRGSTFRIELPAPIAGDEEEIDEVSGVVPAPFFAEEESQVPRILVVDDDRVLQRLLGIFINRMGYKHDVAINGQDALKHIDQNQYDLILLDLQMPVMDGYETARQIRLRYSSKELPVLALTAKAIQDDLNRCLRAGCDSYITKPVVFSKLAQQIHRYLHPPQEPTPPHTGA